MSKQFAIYHTEKGRGSGGGLSNHIDRTPGKEHTYKNADPKLKGENINIYTPGYKNLSIPQGIKKRIAEGYNQKRKIRSDAVKFLSHIFSGSHEQMKKIFNNEEAKHLWISKSIDFAAQEFGEKNIIKISVHLDEKTPHIHITTVPLTPDGRMSAREIIGNSKKMEKRQDRYAELMKPFGLERGIKGTGIRHEKAQEFNGRVAMVELEMEKIKVRDESGKLDRNGTLLNMDKALKSAKMMLLDPQKEQKREREIKGNLKR